MGFKRILTIFSKVLIVALISAVMLLVLLEVSIANRLLPDLRPIIPLVDDPILRHRVDTAFTGVDADGWRNFTVLENADIVAIGDSQTYGVAAQIQDAYPQQLAQQTGLDVYNLAVGGYGPVHYSYLLDTALEKSPETIIIGVYLGNDIYDCQTITELPYWRDNFAERDIYIEESPYDPASYIVSADGTIIGRRPFGEDFTVSEGRALDEETKDNVSGVKQLLNSSMALGYLWYGVARPIAISQASQFEGIKTAVAQAESANGNLQVSVAYEDDKIMVALTPYRRWVALNWESEVIQNGYSICEQHLEDIQERCVANDAHCLFVIIPTKEAVYAPYLTAQGFELKGYYSLLMQMENDMRDRLLTFFDSIDGDVLDVTHPMQVAAQQYALEKQLIYPFHYDSHPNGNGYGVIATAIADHLDI